jgi:UDP-GlcNAc:undecaprenyl-phosphate/decaprenyl-phosphate GlcNAc-1-phosphate transferase
MSEYFSSGALMAAGVTLALSVALTWIMIALAQKNNWVCKPKADRWHTKPTALYGGVAIFGAFAVGCAGLFQPFQLGQNGALSGLLIGAVIIFAVGLRDDIRALNPLVKLMGQVMAVMPLLVGMLLATPSTATILILPLIFSWVVLLTNSLNLLDNMDGLSAGTAATIGALLSAFAFLTGQPQIGAISAVLVASCLGFLVFNFPVKGSARIFMGDSSSMLLGFVLSGLSALAARPMPNDKISPVLLPLFLMAVPLLDTTLVIIRRKREGRAISQGGRDHTSHRLVYAGLTEKQAVMMLYLVSLLCGGVGVGLVLLEQPLAMIGAMVGGIFALTAFGNFLARFTGPTEAVTTKTVREKTAAEV